MNTKKILIVEDHLLVAEAIANLLDEHEVTITVNRQEALAAIVDNQYDFALVDINLKEGENGLSLIKPLLMARIKPIVVSGVASIGQLRACIRLGAYGYIDKTLPSSHVAEVLTDVAEGKLGFPNDIIDELRQDPSLSIPKLGKSEKRLLDYYIFHRDQTNSEIGDKMALSEGRIRNCMTTLMRKFDVKGRANLAKEADLRGYFPGIDSSLFS